MIGLNRRATVYGEGASTYDQVLKADLPCRMSHVDATNSSNQGERAELLSMRRVLWDPDYVMPENAQIEVDGVRWQLVAGSFAAFRGPSNQITYRAADAVRQV